MLRIGVPLAVIGLLLGGCVATPAPSVTGPSALPAPDPTPTESGAAQLFLGPDGIGSMVLGEPVGADDTFMRFDPAGCADLGIPAGEPYAGFWRSASPGESGESGSELIPFWAMTAGGLEAGAVERIGAGIGGITTETGVGIGDSFDAVMSAYPDGFDQVIEGWASDVYVVDGDLGQLAIEITKPTLLDGSEYWPDDLLDTVLVLAATVHPIQPLAGGDGAGPCPL